MGDYSSKASFDKCLGYVDKAKQAGGKVLIGGVGDDSKGYFVQPTVIETADPLSVTMREEIFGPVLTAYVYDDDKFEDTCRLIDRTTDYGLTGCMCVFLAQPWRCPRADARESVCAQLCQRP